jgi:hypothetical protein
VTTPWVKKVVTSQRQPGGFSFGLEEEALDRVVFSELVGGFAVDRASGDEFDPIGSPSKVKASSGKGVKMGKGGRARTWLVRES